MKNNLTTSTANARRIRVVKLRLTDNEMTDLRARANETALAIYVRQILFVNCAVTSKQHERKKPAQIDKNDESNAVVREIAKIGNNLNQIARAVNTNVKNNNSTDMVIFASRLLGIWEEVNVLQNLQARTR